MMCDDIALQHQQNKMLDVCIAFMLIELGHIAMVPTHVRMSCNFVHACGNGRKQVHLVDLRPKLL